MLNYAQTMDYDPLLYGRPWPQLNLYPATTKGLEWGTLAFPHDTL